MTICSTVELCSIREGEHHFETTHTGTQDIWTLLGHGEGSDGSAKKFNYLLLEFCFESFTKSWLLWILFRDHVFHNMIDVGVAALNISRSRSIAGVGGAVSELLTVKIEQLSTLTNRFMNLVENGP